MGYKDALVKKLTGSSDALKSEKRLHGGDINTVELWETEQGQKFAVKIADKLDDAQFLREFEAHKFFYEKTQLPVPQPYALLNEGEHAPVTVIIMEYIDAAPFGRAFISPLDNKELQRDLASHIINLHKITAELFGDLAGQQQSKSWSSLFGETIRREFEQVRAHLSSSEAAFVEDMLSSFKDFIPDNTKPRLIHGDLWSGNILVDKEQPRVRAFLDFNFSSFADTEFELAFLQIFSTASEEFMNNYRREHEFRKGFRQRQNIYDLNTMLRHLRHSGRAYLGSVKSLIRSIKADFK